jgi:hypothetical protein
MKYNYPTINALAFSDTSYVFSLHMKVEKIYIFNFPQYF